MLYGPSGNGVQDYFTPEINSQALGFPAGEDWTSDNAATMQYDSYKVQAILNEIDGYNHSRTSHVGVPAIFGMNFQTVSTAQKLPTSDGLTGGYLPGGKVPGPLLVRALNYINTQVGRMVGRDQAAGPGGQHGPHHLGQARPVPHRPERPQAGPGRPDHRRGQRGLDGGPPRGRRAGHLLHRRRRHAAGGSATARRRPRTS